MGQQSPFATAIDLFSLARKNAEAQAVKAGIPVKRNHTDADLATSMALLDDCEQLIRETQAVEAALDSLETAEQAIARAAHMHAFDVTLTQGEDKEHIHILAPNSCTAIERVMDMRFGNDKPPQFKIKVEPLKAKDQWRHS